MKKTNQNGFMNILIYCFIFAIFSFTVYACLDVLQIIEVPEKYSVAKWLSEHIADVSLEEYETADDSMVENLYKKVRIEVENDTDVASDVSAPTVNSYASAEESYASNHAEFSYYAQLDDYAKIIYTELDKNLENMKSGTYHVKFGTTFNKLLHEENGEEILNNSFQVAINALNFDNPELFYIDISKVYLLTRITTKLLNTTYEVEIGASEGQTYLNRTFANSQDVDQAINRIKQQKEMIESSLSGSDEQKIRQVHDYLVNHLEYDSTTSRDNIYNIYGALINHYTVCEGYARSFKAIMDDINIPCLIACGTGVNSSGQTENHAWNYVMLKGQWYAIDVTWDDPIIIGNGWLSNDVKDKYYLKGSNEFFTNHIENGEIVGNSNFQYPTISQTNYE